jgi:CRISPR system Cascade subunit CasE
MFFSRIALRPNAGATPAFWSVFRGPYSLHQAVWLLFGDSADRERDFLYHVTEHAGANLNEQSGPTIYALSLRPPSDPTNLWHIETKAFDPHLQAGMRLGFLLRVNPVRTRDGKRHDVVMEEKHRLRTLGLARDKWPIEAELVQESSEKWLQDRAEKSGFQLQAVRADGYRQHEFTKAHSGQPVRFSTVDFTGLLEVTASATFREALVRGFGPAKGFGCGLMLLQRA